MYTRLARVAIRNQKLSILAILNTIRYSDLWRSLFAATEKEMKEEKYLQYLSENISIR